MRFKLQTTALVLALMIVLPSLGLSAGQSGPDERLFREAKVLIFDKAWEEAEDLLEEFLSRRHVVWSNFKRLLMMDRIPRESSTIAGATIVT